MPYADYLFRKKSGVYYFRKQCHSRLYCFSLSTRYYRIAKQKAALHLSNILNAGDIHSMSDIPIYYDPRLKCWVLPDEEKIKWVQSNISSELSGDESNEELIALFDAFTQTKRIKVKLGAEEKARRFYDMLPIQPEAPATTPPPQPKTKHLLSEAISGYIEDKRRDGVSNGSLREYEGTLSHLIWILDDRDITSYSKDDMRNCIDTVKQLPPNHKKIKKYKGKSLDQILAMKNKKAISIVTINEHIRLLKAVFDWAKAEDWVIKSPASIIKTLAEPKTKPKSRVRFTNEDLKVLTDSLHKEAETGKLKNRPERFWVPLIAILSGMRSNEICQLRTKDVCQDSESGIWYFNVFEESGETKVKTKAGIRKVPIHPALLELGFLDYYKKISGNIKGRIWLRIKPTQEGKYNRSLGNWFNGEGGFNRRYVTQETEKTFHSTRHSFRDELKQLRVDTDVAAEIVGHEYEEGEAGTYTDDFAFNRKREALQQVTYGLDLHHLKPLAEQYL